MKSDKKCVVCGSSFKPPKYNGARSKYCSPKCRNRFYNKKNQAYNTEMNRLKRLKQAEEPSPLKLQCQICGRWYKKVGSHIWQTHKMTAREYRKEYGFDVKRGQLTDVGRKVMHDHVFSNGTVNNLKAGEVNWFKKGQKGVGVYKRSEQTMNRLKEQGKIIGKKYNKKA